MTQIIKLNIRESNLIIKKYSINLPENLFGDILGIRKKVIHSFELENLTNHKIDLFEVSFLILDGFHNLIGKSTFHSNKPIDLGNISSFNYTEIINMKEENENHCTFIIFIRNVRLANGKLWKFDQQDVHNLLKNYNIKIENTNLYSTEFSSQLI